MGNPKVYWCVKMTIMAILFFTVVSFVVMALWNWLMPELFGLPYISFWKAAGLLLLSKILFSGLGGKKFDKKHKSHEWKSHFSSKHPLTPEQKQELKEKFASRWCTPKEDKSEEADSFQDDMEAKA